MLVLTRNKDESIMIGDDIEITIVSPYRAKIGIKAPANVAVHRKEVYEAKLKGESCTNTNAK